MSPPLGSAAALRSVTLDDKYELESGRVYLTGVQALVRLLMLQRQRDKLAGLNTAGFVSGYRGSPLGGLDLALWGAAKFLERAGRSLQRAIAVFRAQRQRQQIPARVETDAEGGFFRAHRGAEPIREMIHSFWEL